MGSNDHIEIRYPIQKFVPLLLRNASSHSNNHSPLLLQPFIPSQSTIDLMFRFLPDTAGVDEDEVGLFERFSFQGNGTPPRDEGCAPCRVRSSDNHRFQYRLFSPLDLAYLPNVPSTLCGDYIRVLKCQMSKFKCQIKSKAKISKVLNLKFDIHLTFGTYLEFDIGKVLITSSP